METCGDILLISWHLKKVKLTRLSWEPGI